MKRAALVLLLLVGCSGTSGSYSVTVTPIDAFGSFNATTTNTGDTSGEASCTIRAYDAFGNRIGYDIFDTSVIAPGASVKWNGKIGIDEFAERYDGECG